MADRDEDEKRLNFEPVAAPIGRPVAEVRAWLAAVQATAGEGFERPEQWPDQERDWDAFD